MSPEPRISLTWPEFHLKVTGPPETELASRIARLMSLLLAVQSSAPRQRLHPGKENRMSKLSAARMATLALGLSLAIPLVAFTPLSAQESSKAQVFKDHPQKGSGERQKR